MSSNNVSLLINTCDKYEDAWLPFFTLLDKYWPDCPYPVFLNTETKRFQFKEKNIISLNNNRKKITWSKRLIDCLRRIKTDYVIMLLEDFFLLDSVKQNEINKTIVWLDSNKDISCFQFHPNKKLLSIEDNIFPGYSKRDMKGRWWLRTQAAIWRRKDLLKYLNPHENIWQFEEYGSNVAKLYNKRFYNCDREDIVPFVYDVDISTGYGLYEGEWLESNEELFKKEGISVDLSKMGVRKNGVRKPFMCKVSKKTIKERFMYLLYGGGVETYMSIKAQFLFLFKSPKHWIKMLAKKLVYFLTPYGCKSL